MTLFFTINGRPPLWEIGGFNGESGMSEELSSGVGGENVTRSGNTYEQTKRRELHGAELRSDLIASLAAKTSEIVLLVLGVWFFFFFLLPASFLLFLTSFFTLILPHTLLSHLLSHLSPTFSQSTKKMLVLPHKHQLLSIMLVMV